MELKLNKNLPHQQKAIDVIVSALEGVSISNTNDFFVNKIIDKNSLVLKENIKALQKNIHPTFRGGDNSKYINLDIKMETGTGKTYVYVKTIFELHKRYGLNKFIILVPSLPIKAGTKQFIDDSFVKKHFSDVCAYNAEIELLTLESQKKKKGKNHFPYPVREFVDGSKEVNNKIYVLLANMHLFKDTKNGMLSRDDYDYSVQGFYNPTEAIAATKPILIIDEPHRFSTEKSTYQYIENKIKPQLVIRYGATYPESKGKKDYNNLIYNLDSCEAFNNNLIKGVSKEHLNPISEKKEKIKVVSVVSNTSVNLKYMSENTERTLTFAKGDFLSMLSSSFGDLQITGIGKNCIELSNGQLKQVGNEFDSDIYTTSYQEQMLRLALERHFEIERENFNRQFPIKTLALFFIDDINSYRKNEKEEKPTYLKDVFEQLLRDCLSKQINSLDITDNPLYKEYLEASLANISMCHAGYFSKDNEDSDEAVAQEVSEILFEKKKLLSVKDSNGFVVRRFLFSKWTLKEGWDNPNVFTIAKLRSSGSDNSKLQEVGRGLRLPVDINGNRIENELFYLNYVVDFTEADFAKKLEDEINNELPTVNQILDAQLDEVAKKLNISPDDLFIDLLTKKYIDRNKKINVENQDKFYEEYPFFSTGLKKGKLKDRNKETPKKIRIRKNNYNELKELWEKINERYHIIFDNFDNEFLLYEITNLFNKEVFVDVVLKSQKELLVTTDDGRFKFETSTGKSFVIEKPIPYNEFLTSISIKTSLSILLLHKAIVSVSKKFKLENKHFNEFSKVNFIKKFNVWKLNNLQNKFSYKKSSLSIHPTSLTNFDGSAKDVITQSFIGKSFVAGKPIKEYLYDSFAYDSPLELENMQTEINDVVVFGKIPSSSIRIPMPSGRGTYSPDFMYIVNMKDSSKQLNFVIETKDVDDDGSLREVETERIAVAQKFFEQLKLDGYDVKFRKQIKGQEIASIINELT